MSSSHPQRKFIVFDTNQYAGNFEREMCAYITGRYGECQVGEDIARQVQDELQHQVWYEGYIAHETDDRGCSRPAATWGDPAGRSHTGVAIFLEEFPPDEVLAEMVARAKQFCVKNRLKLLGCRLLQPHYEVKQVHLVSVS